VGLDHLIRGQSTAVKCTARAVPVKNWRLRLMILQLISRHIKRTFGERLRFVRSIIWKYNVIREFKTIVTSQVQGL